jgi:predicted HAD superfamily Cof-like phosphohydrolase
MTTAVLDQVTRLQKECNILLERRRALSWQAMVHQFQDKMGLTIGDEPAIRDAELRKRLVLEEAQEFVDAVDAGDLVEAVDALADIIYVVLGSAVTFGVDMAPIMAIVHAANMTKDPALRDDNGKIAKPKGFIPPDASIRLELTRQKRF